MPDEYRVPGGKCPCCGAGIDAATSVSGTGPPRPGTLTICMYCGKALQLNAKMAFEPLRALPASFSKQERRRFTLLRAHLLTHVWLRRRGITGAPTRS